jgi:hypothetical protein
MNSEFRVGHDDEYCPEISSYSHSPLSLGKDTAAAATTDNTPASVKYQPALALQQKSPNRMKHIIFVPCHESNHGSAPQAKQTVHQKNKSTKDIDSSEEDIPSTSTRKHKKSIAKISGGNSSSK